MEITSSGLNEWSIYNKYDIFSVEHSDQRKIVLTIFLLSFIEGLMEYFEIMNLSPYFKPGKYWLINLFISTKVESGDPEEFIKKIKNALIELFAVLHGAGHIIRFKSMLSVIYASRCIKIHLKNFNEQLIMSHHKQNKPVKQEWESSGPVTRKISREKSTTDARKTTTERVDMAICGLRFDDIVNESSYGELMRNSSEDRHYDRVALESSTISTSGGFSDPSTTELIRVKIETTNFEKDSIIGQNMELPTKKIDQSVCMITTLHQLEIHLTKLAFFVEDLDKNSAVMVYTLCQLCFVQTMVCVFCSLLFEATIINFVLILAYGLLRLVIPYQLFTSCGKMEEAARETSSILEATYLKYPSESLIYKQYESTLKSLSRIVKRLNSIRFTCDNLMEINTITIRNYAPYILTSTFIVIQFGKYFER